MRWKYVHAAGADIDLLQSAAASAGYSEGHQGPHRPTELVREFYEHALKQENALCLKLGAIPEELRQARIAHYAEVAKNTKEAWAPPHVPMILSTSSPRGVE